MFVSSLAASCDLPILYIQGLYSALGRLSVYLYFYKYNLQGRMNSWFTKRPDHPLPLGPLFLPPLPRMFAIGRSRPGPPQFNSKWRPQVAQTTKTWAGLRKL